MRLNTLRTICTTLVAGLCAWAPSAVCAADDGPILGSTVTTSTSVGGAPSAQDSNGTVPDRAWQTLQLIDAGQWPPEDGSGTHGGATWPNREQTLPVTDASGNRIQYQEWDVNRKQPGHARDAERIVTGSTGTAWYTPDRFRTFNQMR
ncbi:ribonuclease domain-containing protein [Actinomycetota bacterium Odt1-20B]